MLFPPLIVTRLLLRDIIRAIDRGFLQLDQLLPPLQFGRTWSRCFNRPFLL